MYILELRDVLHTLCREGIEDPNTAIRPYSGEFFMPDDVARFAPDVASRPVLLTQIWAIDNLDAENSGDLRTNNETARFRLYCSAGNYRSKAEAADNALTLASEVQKAIHGKRIIFEEAAASSGVFIVENIAETFTTDSVSTYTMTVRFNTKHNLDD